MLYFRVTVQHSNADKAEGYAKFSDLFMATYPNGFCAVDLDESDHDARKLVAITTDPDYIKSIIVGYSGDTGVTIVNLETVVASEGDYQKAKL